MRVRLAFAQNPFATGVDRYARELGAALRGMGVAAEDLPIQRREMRMGALRIGGSVSLWAQRLRVTRGDADVLHALDPAIAPRRADVITIQDLLNEQYAEEILPTAGHRLDWRLSRALARRARWFITPSEATRQELVARWGVPAERIVAIPHGIDHARFRPPASRPEVEKPTFVYVGDDNPRKNILLAVRALAQLRDRHGIDARFVRVGPSRFPAVHEAYRAEAAAGRVDLVEPGFVDDDALVMLLGSAAAFLWPTRGEGFGFPPLEAMACAAPVVALDTPINREVCGATARYHADDAGACADALAKTLEHPPRREDVLAHARTYTWETAAQRTLAVYGRAR